MARKQQKYTPIFIEHFPNYELAPMQLALYNAVKWMERDSNGNLIEKPPVDELFIFIARQSGKSKVCSTIWWQRIIYGGENEDVFIATAPMEKDIYDILIDDIFLEAFGGAKEVEDINAVYVTAPEKFEKSMVEKWEDDIKNGNGSLYKKWFDNPKHANQWAIKRKGEDGKEKIFFKLFVNDIKGANNSNYTGTIFNGSKVMCVSPTFKFGDKIRGKKIKGVYGEEISQYASNPFGALGPAIISQGGWMMFAGTPPEDDSSWIHEDVWGKIRKGESLNYQKKLGMELYSAQKKVEIPAATYEEMLKGDKRFTVRTQLNVIGRLEEIFPFIYNGPQRFAEIQACRERPSVIKPMLNSRGKPILDEETVIDGVFSGFYKYTIEPSKEPNPGAPVFSEEQYQREYQMNFGTADEKAFPTFTDSNIIKQEDFDPSYFYTAAGYDHGAFQGKIRGIAKGSGKSASVWVKVAVNIVNGAKQYIIYDEKFIEDPREISVNNEWQGLLNSGCPIIYDRAIANTHGGSNSVLNAILRADPSIIDNPRYNDGFFPGQKRIGVRDKVNDYKAYFKEHTDKRTKVRFKHPIFIKEDGYKLYITDNCINLIEWFDKQSWVVTSKKGGSKETQVKELRKFRDDAWDAVTYCIDTIESNYNYIYDDLLKFWRRYGSEESSNQQYNTIANTYGAYYDNLKPITEVQSYTHY
jgi:hypothetical protein